MIADINTCLARIQSVMETELAPVYANAIYDYRTGPDKLKVSVSLSFQGGLPAYRTTGGGVGQFYDITAVIGATSDGSENGLRAADQALNALENQIYGLLTDKNYLYSNEYWEKVSFPTPSTRPPNFSFSPTTRYGEIPFRLHL